MSQINVGQVNSSVGITLPSYSNSSRPTNAAVGAMIFNTDEGGLEVFDGTSWILTGTASFAAVGGIESFSGAYKVHTYNVSSQQTTYTSTFEVTSAPANSSVEVLVVAGGGGAPYHGGGGGGGGVVYASQFPVTKGTYSVQVGRGGTGHGNPGQNGDDSVFGSLTAIGGGGGATGDALGQSGGSGGGSGVRYTSGAGAGTPNQGNGGGVGGPGSPYYGAGGGGGAGGPGANGTSSGGGAGGAGVQYNLTGTAQYYAGGGGGSSYNNSNSGAGGSSVGGAGSYGPGAGDAVANTGSGGGGRDFRGSENKGNGLGSAGVVIVRYLIN